MKTSDLIGPALDWAVAKCEGKDNDCEIHAGAVLYGRVTSGFIQYKPATDWSQGGPIIEREGIRIEPEKYSATGFASWRADIPKGPTSPHGYKWTFGPTPLIAAMRCYLASKLGDEITLPEELNV